MNKIRFATTNEYKLKYANNILNKYGWEVVPTKVELIEPQSMSQEEISIFKVKQAFKQLRIPVVTMDSGVFITSLNGFPGVYSNPILKMLSNKYVFKLLKNETDRSAYIEQTVSFYDGKMLKTFNSKSEGVVVTEKEAGDGFSIDGFFRTNNSKKIYGNMTEDEKAKAWGQCWVRLVHWLDKYNKSVKTH
jgi:XTP/dITP diphosphohydrolase